MLASQNLWTCAVKLKDRGHFGTKEPWSHIHHIISSHLWLRKALKPLKELELLSGVDPAGPQQGLQSNGRRLLWCPRWESPPCFQGFLGPGLPQQQPQVVPEHWEGQEEGVPRSHSSILSIRRICGRGSLSLLLVMPIPSLSGRQRESFLNTCLVMSPLSVLPMLLGL